MTYREQFSNMADLRHDKNANNSDVCKHISTTLGCDIFEAKRVFNVIRQPKSSIIVFNKNTDTWSGVDLVNNELLQITKLRSRLAKVEKEMRRLKGLVEVRVLG